MKLMLLNKIKLLYFVAVTSLIVFTSLSGNVGPYSFPSSVQALNIASHGKISLPFQLPISSYWPDTLLVEKDYPVPSLILAIFYLITNISPDFLPFFPVSGFMIFLFYYIILLKVLLEGEESQSLSRKSISNSLTFLAYLLVIHNLFARTHAYYVGRATLGVVYFVILVYLLLRLATSNKKNSWIFTTLIILITIAFTYYTSILAISITLFLLLFTYAIKFSLLQQRTKEVIFSLAIVSLFLVIIQPIVNVLTFSPSRFIDNIISWVLAQLKIERGEAYYLTVGNVPIDLFTRISTVWLNYSLIMIFILAFIFYFLNELIKKRRLDIQKHANILAIVTIGASLAELFYTFHAPTVSLRFITMLSILYVPLVITGINKAKVRRTLCYVMSILLIIFYVGTLNSTLVYGRVNDVQYLYGFNKFISDSVTSYNVVITGDSYYTGYLFFKTSISGDYARVLFTTLGIRTFDLFDSQDTNTLNSSIKKLIDIHVKYLMIVNDGKPITGDPWGYAITPSPTSINYLITHLNTIYHDGYVYLLNLY